MDRGSVNKLLSLITQWWGTSEFTYVQKELIHKELQAMSLSDVDALLRELQSRCKRPPSPVAIVDIARQLTPVSNVRREFENRCVHCAESTMAGYVTIFGPQFVWDYMTGKEPTTTHYTCAIPCSCNTVESGQKYDPRNRWALWQEGDHVVLSPTLAVPNSGGGNSGANPKHQTEDSHLEYLRLWLEDHQPPPAAWQAYRDQTQGVDEFAAWNAGA